jgi:hypothetical protein
MHEQSNYGAEPLAVDKAAGAGKLVKAEPSIAGNAAPSVKMFAVREGSVNVCVPATDGADIVISPDVSPANLILAIMRSPLV